MTDIEAQTDGFHSHKGVGARYGGIAILGGSRTPFGAFTGGLSRVNPIDLGIVAARAALENCRLTGEDIDQVIFSSVAQSGPDAYYLPRHVGLYAGVPLDRPALLVQRICGSGFEAVIQAAEQISLGKADIVLVGGTESMSLNPLAAYGIRQGHEMGKPGFVDTLWEELYDPACGLSMGQTAENLARMYGITRPQADEFAFKSQENYRLARESGFFTGEITPVRNAGFDIPGLKSRSLRLPRGIEEITLDEHPRQTSLDKLSRLKPVFQADGVHTAGNSSGIADGACALVVASARAAQKSGLEPLGWLRASVSVGVLPGIMGIGPGPAIGQLLTACRLDLSHIDCFEINEAFAGQCLAVFKEAGLDPDRVNVNGGAIAVGHPLAASGARLTLTLLRQLKRASARLGIAGACIGGGQGTVLLLEAT